MLVVHCSLEKKSWNTTFFMYFFSQNLPQCYNYDRSLCVDDKQNASISKSIIDLERSQGVTCNILNDIKNNAIKSYVNNRNEHCDIVHSTEAVKHTANSNSKSDYTNLSCSLVSMQKPNYYTDYHKEDASDYDRYSLTTVPDNSSGFSEDSFFTDEIINNLIHE